MLLRSLTLLATGATLAAQTPTLPSFSEQLNSPPLLSLSDSLKLSPSRTPVQPVAPKAPGSPAPAQTGTKSTSRAVSRMPVLVPTENNEMRIAIVAPNPALDHTLRVIEPSVDVVK